MYKMGIKSFLKISPIYWCDTCKLFSSIFYVHNIWLLVVMPIIV